jgi:hypothetical protein
MVECRLTTKGISLTFTTEELMIVKKAIELINEERKVTGHKPFDFIPRINMNFTQKEFDDFRIKVINRSMNLMCLTDVHTQLSWDLEEILYNYLKSRRRSC